MSLRSLCLYAFFGALLTLTLTQTAAAQKLQIDAELNSPAGGPWQMGLATVGSAAKAGILLSDRVAIQTGLSLLADLETGDDRYHGRYVGIPLEATYYFSEAKPQTLIPSLRVGGNYGQSFSHNTYFDGQRRESSDIKNHVVGATLLIGANYFINEHVAVSVQGGPTYTKVFLDSEIGTIGAQKQSTQSLGMQYRLGIILRS